MNDEQLLVIVTLLTGLEAAVLHLANVIAEHKPDEKETLSKSFEAMADGMANQLLALPFLHIASGLRNSTRQQMNDLLDRLRRGPTPPPSAPTGG